MIHELAAADYDRIRTLYQPLTFMPFCAGVLEGGHEGRIFVDDPRQPRTAFMLTWGCWGYLSGDPGNVAWLHDLNEAIFAKTFLGEHAWGLFLSCPPDGWAEGMAAVCAPHPPIELPRRHYVAHEIREDWQNHASDGYVIRRMDCSLLDLPEQIPGDVQKMIDATDWDAATVDKGCGFVAVRGDEIAAWSMIDCVVGDVGEIGLFTQETHRRRGLATATSAATIAYGLSHGLSTVVWDCYIHNLGSVRTAEKLGLVPEREHTMHLLLVDENNHWAMKAWHDADGGHYGRTLKACARLFAQQAKPPELAHVAAARACAAMGEPSTAFEHLNQAVDAGWNYLPDLSCREFDVLRDRSDWQALLARMNA